MSISRLHTWVAGDVLLAADLNGEFNNIVNGGIAIVSPATGAFNMNSFQINSLANGAAAQDAVTFLQVFTSPAFTGTPTAPTAAGGTNTTQLATTAFVASTGMSAALPGQLNNKSNRITTDGTAASWTNNHVFHDIQYWMGA